MRRRADKIVASSISMVAAQLSNDARQLHLFLSPTGMGLPTAALLNHIQHECQRLEVAFPLTEDELRARMQSWNYGAWQPIYQSPGAIPPVDERVEVLAPITTGLGHAQAACFVTAGTPLARKQPGRPGAPGQDLLGRPIVPRAPRAARLPQGENTQVSADGNELVATCDGVAFLHQLRIQVAPMDLHEGDVTADMGVLESTADLLVRGSVRQGRVRTGGSVRVEGAMMEGLIHSEQGDISVTSGVVGTSTQVSTLRARGDIYLDHCRFATVSTEGDLHLSGAAQISTLKVGGHLYLAGPLDRVLHTVTLHLGGNVVTPFDHTTLPVPRSQERQYVRVPANFRGELAKHGWPLSPFVRCIVEDLSANGARCQLLGPESPRHSALDHAERRHSDASDHAEGRHSDASDHAEGMSFGVGVGVQLKFALPSQADSVVVVGRVIRRIDARTIAVGFEQITQRDRDRLLDFCRQPHRAKDTTPSFLVQRRQ